MIRQIASLLPIFFSMSVSATVFQTHSSPAKVTRPVIIPVNPVNMIVFSSDYSKSEILSESYSRNRDGNWGALKTLSKTSFSALGGSDELIWMPQESATNSSNHYVIFSGVNCSGNDCFLQKTSLVVYRKDSLQVSNILDVSYNCSKPMAPDLQVFGDAIIVNNGCGKLLEISAGGIDLQPVHEKNSSVYFSKQFPEAFWYVSDSFVNAYSLNGDKIGSFALPVVDTECYEISSDHVKEIRIQCSYLLEGKETFKTYLFSHDQQTETTSTIKESMVLGSVIVGEHRYVSRENKATDPSVEILNMSDYSRSDIYSARNFKSNIGTLTFSKLQRPASFKSEPSGFYAVTSLMQKDNRTELAFFDAIPQNFPPYMGSVTSIDLMSGRETSFTWRVFDEESLARDLIFEDTTKPDWVSFDVSEKSVVANPKHSNVGLHEWSQLITDKEGASINVEWVLNVILSPFEMLVFESNWFKKWGIENPIPLRLLLSQIKNLPATEDTYFEWVFSVSNREPGDVEISGSGSMLFNIQKHADSNALLVSGTPAQKNVGLHSLELVFKDAYSEKPFFETVVMDVIEVDEPFTIKSSPILSALVGEKYSYQIHVDDEESSISEFTIQIVEIPSFMSIDKISGTISGVPSRQDVGPHTIALLLQDQGGFRVLHTWGISVRETELEGTSGGSFSFLLPIIMLFILLFRFSRYEVLRGKIRYRR